MMIRKIIYHPSQDHRFFSTPHQGGSPDRGGEDGATAISRPMAPPPPSDEIRVEVKMAAAHRRTDRIDLRSSGDDPRPLLPQARARGGGRSSSSGGERRAHRPRGRGRRPRSDRRRDSNPKTV